MQQEYVPLVQEFLRLLRDQFGDRVIAALVFGSVARGTARPDSDVDLCLVMRGLPTSRYRRHQVVAPVVEALRMSPPYLELVGRGYAPDMAIIIYTPEDIAETKPIFLDMVEEGEILMDDGTLRTKLDSLRERLRELGSRKISLPDGTYYWLLKPGLRFGDVIEL